MSDLYLGVDVGGTNVKIGLCDAAGKVRASESIKTEATRGPEETAERIAGAVKGLVATADRPRACGTGVPGPLNLERTILFNAINMPGWTDVRWPEILGPRLDLPTHMENDANCAAWGEYRAGAGRGTKSMVLYTLGTGVGGGVILNGDLWTGASGAAGELGHMNIDPSGEQCGCGQVGCLEVYASATAVVREYGGGTAREIFEAAKQGEEKALQVVREAADRLAVGCSNMIHVLHPEVIVLAGGMAAAGDLLFEGVRAGVRKRVFPVALEKIRIEPGQLGDDAGWLGASLWAARRMQRPIREPTTPQVTP